MRNLARGVLMVTVALTAIVGAGSSLLPRDHADAASLDVLAAAGEATLDGRVASSSNGGSVGGASVELDLEPADGTPEYETRTDFFGFFHFDGIEHGVYKLTVAHPAFGAHNEAITFSGAERATLAIALEPLSDEPYFDLTFDVQGVMTQIRLGGAEVLIERWRGSNTDGTPVETRTLVTDVDGLAEALGLRQAFYSFTVTRDGWETLRFPESGARLIAQAHMAIAALKPVTQQLRVTVMGDSAIEDKSDQPLKGITVEITGLDFDEFEIVPPRAGVTGADGTYEFHDLPPIPWLLTVKRLGYETFEDTIYPDENGQFDPVDVDLVMLPTQLHVALISPYTSAVQFDRSALVLLEGIRESNTEGISRRLITPPAPGRLVAEARLAAGQVGGKAERLLPGRYWLHVALADALTCPPGALVDVLFSQGVLTKEQACYDFRVTFKPVETYVELGPGERLERYIDLEPVPATVNVQLLAADEVADQPIYHPVEQDGVLFEETASLDRRKGTYFNAGLLPEGTKAASFDTDESGRFTAELLPGRYGIRIPTMVDYTDYSVQLSKNFSDGNIDGADQRGWPRPDRLLDNPGARGGPPPTEHLALSSGEEYTVTLRVHSKRINLVGWVRMPIQEPRTARLARDLDPTFDPGEGVLVGSIVDHRLTDLVNFGGEATLSGEVEQKTVGLAPVGMDPRHTPLGEMYVLPDHPHTLYTKGASYRFEDVGPGTYVVSVTHPRMSFDTTREVTVGPWPTPGGLPDPDNPPTHVAGTTSAVDDIISDYQSPGVIRYSCKQWIQEDVPGFEDPFESYDGLCLQIPRTILLQPAFSKSEGVFWKIPTPMWWPEGTFLGRAPIGAYSVSVELTDGRWYTWAGSGDADMEVYLGGPSENVTSSRPISQNRYGLEVRVVSSEDASTELDDVEVIVGGVPVRNGSDILPGGGLTIESVLTPGWTFEQGTETVETLSLNPIKLRLTIPVARAMELKGVVSGGETGALNEASVQVLTRYGRVLKRTETKENGSFEVSVGAQIVYLDVQAPGFVPHRQRLEPTGATDGDGPMTIDLQSIKLQRLPSPVLTDFTLNRFGLFIPGVLRSGDATGYDTESARDDLTLTWTINASDPGKVDLSGFDGSDGEPDTVTYRDRIREVWLLDRRWFSALSLNVEEAKEGMAASSGEVKLSCVGGTSAPCVVEHAVAMELLAEVTSAKKAVTEGDKEEPYYVLSRRVVAEGEGPARTFSGKLNLWELPSGELRPMAMVITEGGAVAVWDYQLPSGKNPLKGLKLPPWIASFMDIIGAAATYSESWAGSAIEDAMPKGQFTVSPKFDAGIEKSKDDYLTYVYHIGADWNAGTKTPESGSLASGPGLLGFGFKGAVVEIKVDGEAGKVSVKVKASIGADLLSKDGSGAENFKPSFFRDVPVKKGGKLRVVGLGVTGSGALEWAAIDPDWLEKGNRAPDLQLSAAMSVGVNAEWRIDISEEVTTVSRFLPPPLIGAAVGTALQALTRSGALTFDVVIPVGVQGSRTYTFCTYFPTPAGEEAKEPATGSTLSPDSETTVERTLEPTPTPEPSQPEPPAQPPRWGFLGGAEDGVGKCPKTDLETRALSVVFGVGLGATVGEDLASLTGSIQVGAPAGRPDLSGLKMTFNPESSWPPITRVEGAVSGIVKAAVDLWVVALSKTLQFDFYRIDWPFGTEAFFELVPLQSFEVVVTPATASSAAFNGGDQRLIKGFYPAGSLDVTQSGPEAMAFTDIDQARGEMTLMVSILGVNGWRDPVQVAAAPGIIDVSIAPNRGEGWIVVWSELSAADVGNPYPSSVVRYATSDGSGQRWSDPADIAEAPATAYGFRLARAGDRVLLVYLTTDEGIFAPERSMHSTAWDGSRWSSVQQVLPRQRIAKLALAGNSGGPGAVLAVTDGAGSTETMVWKGAAWSERRVATTTDAFALAINGAGQTVMAWEKNDGSIHLSLMDRAGSLSDLGTLASDVSIRAMSLTPMTDGAETTYLVTWTEGADINSVFYTLAGSDGTVLVPVTEATPGSSGTYRGLHVQPVSGRAARVVVPLVGESTDVHQFELHAGPDLRAAMSANDVNGGRLLAGDELEYIVRITNLSSSDVLDGPSDELSAPVPSGAAYVAGSIAVDGVPDDDDTADGVGFDSGGNRVVWNGLVPQESVRVITYRVRTDSGLGAGDELVSQATVAGSLPTDDPFTLRADDPTTRTISPDRQPGAATPTPVPSTVPTSVQAPTPVPTAVPTSIQAPTPAASTPTPGPVASAAISPTPHPPRPSVADISAKRTERFVPASLVGLVYCDLFGLRCE